MINLTRLWTGTEQPARSPPLRPRTPGRKQRPHPAAHRGLEHHPDLQFAMCPLLLGLRSAALRWRTQLGTDGGRGCRSRDLQSPRLAPFRGRANDPSAIFDLVELASDTGIKLTISTNGTRITRENAWRLKDANVAYVGISLDGIGEVHDQFRGKRGAFDAAVRGFRLCREVEQKTGLRLTLTRHNVENIERILDFIEQEDIPRVCFYHLVPAGREYVAGASARRNPSGDRYLDLPGGRLAREGDRPRRCSP